MKIYHIPFKLRKRLCGNPQTSLDTFVIVLKDCCRYFTLEYIEFKESSKIRDLVFITGRGFFKHFDYFSKLHPLKMFFDEDIY